MEFEFNRDIKTRDEIIFGEYDEKKYHGGVRRFENLDLTALEKLVDQKFIDLEDAQNASPTVEEFLAFMKAYPDYTAHGYTVVNIDRNDYRVTLEGIGKNYEANDKEELKDFVKMFHSADELCIDKTMYCWYD